MLDIIGAARERQNTRWNARDHGIIRDIASDNGICANCDIMTNPDAAKYLGSRTDEHAVANYRHARPLTTIGLADSDPLRDIAVLADFDLGMNNNPAPVPDIKPASDLGLMTDFYPIFDRAAPEH